jgi:hypothetical protein
MKKLFTHALAATMFVACGIQKPMTDAQYEQSVRKDIPFAVSEFKQVKPEVYAFKCDKYVDLLPDYEVDNEGTSMIWRTTFSSTHAVQPQQYIWRNVMINKRNCRVLCIDRLHKDGKTFGYVYVLQGETKQVPNGFHWDVTDQRHMLNVAPILEEQTDLSIELLKTLLQ